MRLGQALWVLHDPSFCYWFPRMSAQDGCLMSPVDLPELDSFRSFFPVPELFFCAVILTDVPGQLGTLPFEN